MGSGQYECVVREYSARGNLQCAVHPLLCVRSVACLEVPPRAMGPEVPPTTAVGSKERSFVSHDEALCRFSQKHPGFGGLRMSADGALVISFVGAPSANETEILEFATAVMGAPARGRHVFFERAEYPFRQLYETLRAIVTRADQLELTMFDVDEVRHVVRVGVAHETALSSSCNEIGPATDRCNVEGAECLALSSRTSSVASIAGNPSFELRFTPDLTDSTAWRADRFVVNRTRDTVVITARLRHASEQLGQRCDAQAVDA